MKVHRRTVALLPWSEPLLVGDWSDEDERPLPLSNLRRTGRLVEASSHSLAAIYLLKRRASGRSGIEVASLPEVLAAAAADNVRTSSAGILPHQARHFSALAEIFRRVPAFQLAAGPDPSDLGETILSHFREMPS